MILANQRRVGRQFWVATFNCSIDKFYLGKFYYYDVIVSNFTYLSSKF